MCLKIFMFCFFFLYFCECQYEKEVNKVKKVVNGTVVEIEEYYFMASIQYMHWIIFGRSFYDKHVCGGVIISLNWILTTAHCLDKLNISNTWVCAGAKDPYSAVDCKFPEKFIKHPAYNKTARFNNNIGLIQLNESFPFRYDTKPINIARKLPVVNTSIMLTGFGRFKAKGRLSIVLTGVQVKIINRNKCIKMYKKKKRTITESMFCAMAPGKGPCKEDAGGPAVKILKKGRKILVGLISSERCADRYFPDIYTNVPFFRMWIKQLTGI